MATITYSPSPSPNIPPDGCAILRLHYVSHEPSHPQNSQASTSPLLRSPSSAAVKLTAGGSSSQELQDCESVCISRIGQISPPSRCLEAVSMSEDGGVPTSPGSRREGSNSPLRTGPGGRIEEREVGRPSPVGTSSPRLEARPPSRLPSSMRRAGQEISSPHAPAEERDTILMPARYESCRVSDLVVVIASMLEELCKANATISLNTSSLTRFHSRSPPAVSIKDYLGRLAKHACLIPPILLTMVFLIDRLCDSYAAFQLNALTVHRYLIASATITCKGLSDAFLKNEVYAKVGGVQIRELAILELELLWRLDWRIVPKPDQLVTYYHSLVARCPGYALDMRP